jgi:hypothetical protein
MGDHDRNSERAKQAVDTYVERVREASPGLDGQLARYRERRHQYESMRAVPPKPNQRELAAAQRKHSL